MHTTIVQVAKKKKKKPGVHSTDSEMLQISPARHPYTSNDFLEGRLAVGPGSTKGNLQTNWARPCLPASPILCRACPEVQSPCLYKLMLPLCNRIPPNLFHRSNKKTPARYVVRFVPCRFHLGRCFRRLQRQPLRHLPIGGPHCFHQRFRRQNLRPVGRLC